ncbi:helix-turn-helix domain-containing protein [Methylobacterium sp. NPDC080182]|uniref:helix-turn-helix domain-containing protein n=1 Tax=Methylobacterium sp. NPDC080182 TaxID=3390590 RepID=UPI003CFE8EBF
MARMTLEEIRDRASTMDRAKVDATSEVEIEAHRAADGDADLEVPVNAQVIESPRALRVRLGMTQPEIAAALSIPLGTWRNWEQGRVSLEPAAVALLRVVSRAPDIAMAALSTIKEAEGRDPIQAYYEARQQPGEVWHSIPGGQKVMPTSIRSAAGQYLTGRKSPTRSRGLKPRSA